ncbi:hypothetical protein OCA5_c30350 [Afipia carboxidovorans OM5]|uniref:ABC transporter substrate-binding protein n=2 Tax=Afipia carboxidovorans TaxID=40137 RepID=F8BYX9_AFIC5|nr:hypothetical protein OCA4_c29830 [Afipia carboxidovorans OM4]AEI07719.1 hypothetical protein OCA5_c30350 [Afipia carboxidovorans OM5]
MVLGERTRMMSASRVRRALGGLCALVAFAIMTGAAHAHPHVWITAASKLVFAPDGTVTGVRHAWTFDEMFAAYAVQGLPQQTKGVYTREELSALAQTNIESLKEYAYFTFAKEGDVGRQKKQKFNEPIDYYLDYKDGNLTLHFTLPFRTPFKVTKLALEVFDPSYFIDFQMVKDHPVELVGAPANCKMGLVRPTDSSAPQQKLSEADFMSGENANYGAMFANKVTVECP